jgi:bifunctional non-homologous end joining protein LigD
MSLETYRRKRDFNRTPEPAGEQPSGTGGRFVVQRHRATALHYDFRLEIDGVLVSWAIPRGPSLDASVRRMAIRTEDHPIEYFDFEGVIPKGQYGGGDVIVWDWGTFAPEETDDPGRALGDGELKFELQGEKLAGRFTMVRTGGRRDRKTDDKDAWLLIKKRDAQAVAGWDAEHYPRSVKSGRTNDEVAANLSAVWNGDAPAGEAAIDLSAAREEPMPDFIPPMQATLADAPFTDEDWLFEIKWDGYRLEAVVRDGAVRLWTRRHNDAAHYFPDLTAAPTWIDAREAIVDGEVVAFDGEGNPSFSRLQERTGIRGEPSADGQRPRPRAAPVPVSEIPLAYEVFDLLYLDGRSLLDVPLGERKRLLRSVLRPDPMVRYASEVAGEGEAFYEAARQRGLEGIVAKLRSSRYEPGRRPRSWLKIKLRAEQELVVAGWLEGKGSHKDLGSLVVGVYEGDELRHAGQVGSGIDGPMRRTLLTRLTELARENSPLTPTPRIKGAHWVEPRIVIRAAFAEWTTDNQLRQAAFKGLELDRDPRTVRRERAVETRPAKAEAERAQPSTTPEREPRAENPAMEALASLPNAGTWRVAGRELRLTNLDKLLWPDDEITKRDLIRYYVSIAPVILPHLLGRAANLHRYPDGIGHKGFWQKDVPGHAPAWIARWAYTGQEGPKDYVVVDQVATLAWLAQEAAIEIHPWTSRADDPQKPTYALIDIDPGEHTSWEEVVTLARLYRTALEHLGVIGLPKVSGQRGIQVWVPIARAYSFDQTRDWVERLSRLIAQTAPELVSWEWSKRARGGRARLDYTQNAINRTLVAPYSARPGPGAPVSAPIRWEELDDPDLRPNRWTIFTIEERLRQVGDLFAAGLELEQRLPAL